MKPLAQSPSVWRQNDIDKSLHGSDIAGGEQRRKCRFEPQGEIRVNCPESPWKRLTRGAPSVGRAQGKIGKGTVKRSPGGHAYVRLAGAIERCGEICEGVASCPDSGLVELGWPEAQRLVGKLSCRRESSGRPGHQGHPSAIMLGKAGAPEGRSTSRQK